MKLLTLGVLCLILIGSVAYVTYEDDTEIKTTLIYINDDNNEYSDLYKIDCGTKEFYTSYPERLNLEEVCD